MGYAADGHRSADSVPAPPVTEREGVDAPETWRALASELGATRGEWRAVYVVGPSDAGKSTLCRYLATRLLETGPVISLDCDPGQSRVGPPSTVGMAVEPADEDARRTLRFAGSTSPVGHYLQILAGAVRLAARATATQPDARLVVDPFSYFRQAGAEEFHLQLVEALAPQHLVGLQQGDEVEPLLRCFDRRAGVHVHRLAIEPTARRRAQTERRDYRHARFVRYFRAAVPQTVHLRDIGLSGRVPDWSKPDGGRDRLLGIQDTDGFLLALARLEAADPAAGTLRIVAPPFDSSRVSSIAFGSIKAPV